MTPEEEIAMLRREIEDLRGRCRKSGRDALVLWIAIYVLISVIFAFIKKF